MDSFEVNKVIVSILLIVLVFLGIGKVSDVIFSVKKPETPGYVVDIKENTSLASAAKNDKGEKVDISALLAMGSVEHGEKVFKKCKACHSIKQDGGNKIGPKLWGVMYRPVASITDYKYSKALTSYGNEWSWEEMNGFLLKPSTWIKGNKMGFAGLKKEKDRASVMLYLNQNSTDPLELP